MSNVSGIGDNKTYRGSLPPREPYYYIQAHLDLAGKKANDTFFYFNKENNFNYLNTAVTAYPDPANYRGYYTIDTNALIGEVTVYANSDLALSEGSANVIASGVQIVSVQRASGVAKITLSGSALSVFKLRPGDLIKVSDITNDAGGFNTAVFVPITGISGLNSEVIEYADAGLDFGSALATGATRKIEAQVVIQVGGAYAPTNAVPDFTSVFGLDVWSGPTGYVPGNLLVSEVADSQILYYGKEPSEVFFLGLRPYLALRLGGGNATNTVVSGKLFVVIKVYPKF